jgi:hypothetical protein
MNSYEFYFGKPAPRYRVEVYAIVDHQRVLRERLEINDFPTARRIYTALGPHYDVVQFWSKDADGKPVYQQY